MYPLAQFAVSLVGLSAVFPSLAAAATADEWRSRSIYQLITDRFALPSGSSIDPKTCNPAQAKFCGGTWQGIMQHLDYIQGMGFTAIWISPVNQNIPGPTAYGDPYHGYWIADVSQLNDRFGTADDLRQLSDELHRRGMYLMVDVVVNNVASATIPPNYSQYLFKDPSYYHPYCQVDHNNRTSAQVCWLGDTKVALPDLDTENQIVVSTYNQWVSQFVQDFGIDGLRIDAAKHVRAEFWGPFCKAAGVFCIGEVFGDDIDLAASYQGPTTLDAILNFPQYSALKDAFTIPGPGNMSSLVDQFNTARRKFTDVGVLGNFLENHDLPRWTSFSVDIQSMFNAMAFSFMSDGIPVLYYGQEQRFNGAGDPVNREPLWPSQYDQGDTYKFMAMLNQVRNYLTQSGDWLHQPAQIISYTDEALFLAKGYVITVLTNIGSPPKNASASMIGSGFSPNQVMIDVITCQQVIVGSQGSIYIDYRKGGHASILIPEYYIRGSDICTDVQRASYQGMTPQKSASSGAAPARLSSAELASSMALLAGTIVWLTVGAV
ncbi:glycoside hydrolase family 13 protein [Tulasnella calospora MUT 4182]|uniref:alpha-amylase n=1 Tax=Tulasnella calospora MUT 4182 TaxID=1051891 RepID=A0A0C3LUR3_9AGAM|nr:glycoside hydrolase family 13 protein [Tulasnella calospora MUT 4182]